MPFEDAVVGIARRYASVFLRLALGATFLSGVADRFGLWGPAGTVNLAWGDFQRFTAYTAQLNPRRRLQYRRWPGRPPSLSSCSALPSSWGSSPGGRRF
jgi:hypothetical protein